MNSVRSILPNHTYFILVMACIAFNVKASTFKQGHYYATNDSSTITEYDLSGAVVGSLSLAMKPYYEGLRGLAFGPDNLLYVTFDKWTDGFEVLALNASGEIKKTYTHGVRLGTNSGFGNIEFGNENLFYVASSTGIVKFDIGTSDSLGYFSNIQNTYDIKAMPNGNFLILSKYNLQETDFQGNVLKTITNSGFDYNRAIEYDHFNDIIYLSTSGLPWFSNRLCTLDINTGEILRDVVFNGIMDFCLSYDGNIAVGSSRQAPAFFTNDLMYIESFSGSSENFFITQYFIPEPTTFSLLVIGAVLARRRRKTRA